MNSDLGHDFVIRFVLRICPVCDGLHVEEAHLRGGCGEWYGMKKVISHHTTHNPTPHYTTPHHTTLRHTTPHHTTPHHTTLHHVTPHYTKPDHTTSHLVAVKFFFGLRREAMHPEVEEGESTILLLRVVGDIVNDDVTKPLCGG